MTRTMARRGRLMMHNAFDAQQHVSQRMFNRVLFLFCFFDYCDFQAAGLAGSPDQQCSNIFNTFQTTILTVLAQRLQDAFRMIRVYRRDISWHDSRRCWDGERPESAVGGAWDGLEKARNRQGGSKRETREDAMVMGSASGEVDILMSLVSRVCFMFTCFSHLSTFF